MFVYSVRVSHGMRVTSFGAEFHYELWSYNLGTLYVPMIINEQFGKLTAKSC